MRVLKRDDGARRGATVRDLHHEVATHPRKTTGAITSSYLRHLHSVSGSLSWPCIVKLYIMVNMKEV